MAVTVTLASLRAKGFEVSSLKSEATISLAENDCKLAYFPTSETFMDADVIDLLHSLVYSALLRRRVVVTRYGSVTKVSQYTIAADNAAITEEIRGYCLVRLEAYHEKLKEANICFEMKDMLRIYDELIYL